MFVEVRLGSEDVIDVRLICSDLADFVLMDLDSFESSVLPFLDFLVDLERVDVVAVVSDWAFE